MNHNLLMALICFAAIGALVVLRFILLILFTPIRTDPEEEMEMYKGGAQP